MKIFNTKEIKRGQGDYGEYVIVGFQDEDGVQYSSFDEFLLNVADGTNVDGTIKVTDKNGKKYNNFTADKKSQSNIQLASQPSAKTLPTAVEAPSSPKTDQSVWDKKDRAMARMSALKSAAEVYSAKLSTGLADKDVLTVANEYFDWITQ
jgi:hypothetical protein